MVRLNKGQGLMVAKTGRTQADKRKQRNPDTMTPGNKERGQEQEQQEEEEQQRKHTENPDQTAIATSSWRSNMSKVGNEEGAQRAAWQCHGPGLCPPMSRSSPVAKM
eukprot:10889618-Ditylum_brightwellii.AAC.1